MNDVSNFQQHKDFDFVNTGSPHHVSFVEDVDKVDLLKQGRLIRYSEPYKSKGGTNVNFIASSQNHYLVRTYERGVENETLSCGTGATACALSVGVKESLSNDTVTLKTKGGFLHVDFKRDNQNNFTEIWLSGAATFVFEGVIEIN